MHNHKHDKFRRVTQTLRPFNSILTLVYTQIPTHLTLNYNNDDNCASVEFSIHASIVRHIDNPQMHSLLAQMWISHCVPKQAGYFSPWHVLCANCFVINSEHFFFPKDQPNHLWFSRIFVKNITSNHLWSNLFYQLKENNNGFFETHLRTACIGNPTNNTKWWVENFYSC